MQVCSWNTAGGARPLSEIAPHRARVACCGLPAHSKGPAGAWRAESHSSRDRTRNAPRGKDQAPPSCVPLLSSGGLVLEAQYTEARTWDGLSYANPHPSSLQPTLLWLRLLCRASSRHGHLPCPCPAANAFASSLDCLLPCSFPHISTEPVPHGRGRSAAAFGGSPQTPSVSVMFLLIVLLPTHCLTFPTGI